MKFLNKALHEKKIKRIKAYIFNKSSIYHIDYMREHILANY